MTLFNYSQKSDSAMTRSEYRLVIVMIGEVILSDPSIFPLSTTKQAAKAGNCENGILLT